VTDARVDTQARLRRMELQRVGVGNQHYAVSVAVNEQQRS
jgi:hypothetical protein